MKPVVQLFTWVCLFFLALSATAQGLSPNLVQNGSFESLGQTYNLVPWHNGDGLRPNVTIVVDESWRTPEGTNFVVAMSYICQDVPTVAGQPYLFRFAFGGFDKVEHNRGPLYVTWGPQELVTIPITPVDPRYPPWHYFDFVVLAQSDTTRIAFSRRENETFPYIDDVQVTPVPSEWMALPQSQTAEEGSTAIFRLKTVNSTKGSTCQWFFGGTNALAGATNSFLRLTNLEPALAGLYSVVVSNSALVVTSAPARLTIVSSVKKRTVPVLWAGVPYNSTRFHFECADGPGGPWVPLREMVQTNGKVFFIDCSLSLPEQRLYRVWANYYPIPWLRIDTTTALYLSGTIGSRLRIDYLNAIGPPDAWIRLDTVTLTNTTQLYSSEALLGKIGKLYRVVRNP